MANGDLITDIDYRAMLKHHIESEAGISMAVRRFEFKNPYGVVRTTGQYVASIEEKPTTISQVNTGVYILEPGALKLLKRGEFFNMTDLVQCVLEGDLRVAAFPIHESWVDIGTPNDLREANER